MKSMNLSRRSWNIRFRRRFCWRHTLNWYESTPWWVPAMIWRCFFWNGIATFATLFLLKRISAVHTHKPATQVLQHSVGPMESLSNNEAGHSLPSASLRHTLATCNNPLSHKNKVNMSKVQGHLGSHHIRIYYSYRKSPNSSKALVLWVMSPRGAG